MARKEIRRRLANGEELEEEVEEEESEIRQRRWRRGGRRGGRGEEKGRGRDKEYFDTALNSLQAFGDCGTIASLRVPQDKQTRERKGYLLLEREGGGRRERMQAVGGKVGGWDGKTRRWEQKSGISGRLDSGKAEIRECGKVGGGGEARENQAELKKAEEAKKERRIEGGGRGRQEESDWSPQIRVHRLQHDTSGRKSNPTGWYHNRRDKNKSTSWKGNLG
jgi:hypothetical protein